MNFVLQMIMFVFKMMNFVFKMVILMQISRVVTSHFVVVTDNPIPGKVCSMTIVILGLFWAEFGPILGDFGLNFGLFPSGRAGWPEAERAEVDTEREKRGEKGRSAHES